MGDQGGTYHFANEIHLSGRDHISHTWDRIKQVTHFLVADSLFLYVAHRDVENASYAPMEEDFELVELSLSERPRLGAPEQ
jgi:hypothetical protein